MKMIAIRSTLASDSSADPLDVEITKDALGALGHYAVPDWGVTPIPDADLFAGVRAFQADNALRVDGVMKPGGPTHRALSARLGELAARSPTYKCKKCGGPHGGLHYPYCPPCHAKLFS